MIINRIDAVSSLVDGGGCVMRDDIIIEWHNDKAQPSEADIDAELARLQARQVILNEIERLESEVTQRRLRDAYADSTWMDAQEAKIAVERAKL